MASQEEEDEEQEEEEREEEEKNKGDVRNEFSLPLDDYEQLISEHRQDDQSISSIREESDTTSSPVLPPTKRTRTSKRDSSPANSVADSITSNNNTPEPEEGLCSPKFLFFLIPPPSKLISYRQTTSKIISLQHQIHA